MQLVVVNAAACPKAGKASRQFGCFITHGQVPYCNSSNCPTALAFSSPHSSEPLPLKYAAREVCLWSC